LHRRFPSTSSAKLAGEEGSYGDSDRSPLLAGPTTVYDSIANLPHPDQEWESPLLAGQTNSTWQTEAKMLGTHSCLLTLTFLLQQSLTVASVITVGHIGTVELGAVSLATSTVNSQHFHDSLTDTT
jgi:MATE family multidrug resistance protein